MSRKEWTELGPTGLAITIFKNKKQAAHYSVKNPDSVVREMEYSVAVGQIRRQIFHRDDYSCVHCGEAVVWERNRYNSGEMDERQARGLCVETEDGEYQSGLISVENGQTLCRKCHTGEGGKQDRSPSFTKTVQGALSE